MVGLFSKERWLDCLVKKDGWIVSLRKMVGLFR